MALKKAALRNVIRSVLSDPWMILPEKMDAILECLEMREAGIQFTKAEVQERIQSGTVESRERDSDAVQMVGSVAVINVHGVLTPRMNLMQEISGGMSTQLLTALISKYVGDEKVSSIVLDIDSPGGSAQGNQEVVDTILQLRDSKPIVASVNGMGASAAYYIASACKRVYASPSSTVGSVGCVLIHREASKANEEAGVTFTVLRSSRYKADGNEYEALTDQSRSTLQERVDMFDEQFVESVAKTRNVSVKTVVSEFGQGKIMLADAAKSRGMIDGVKTLDQVVADMKPGRSSTPTATSKEATSMEPRIKAALFARGLISSIDEQDEVCESALKAYFAASGSPKPEDVEKVVAALCATPAKAKAEVVEPVKDDIDETAAKSLLADERSRIAEIKSIAETIGDVSDEFVSAAIDSGQTAEAFAKKAIEARSDQFKSLNLIQNGPAEADKFLAAAETAVIMRAGLEVDKDAAPARELAHLSFSEICQRQLTVAGQAPPPGASKEDIAAAFLKIGGTAMPQSAVGGASNDPAYHGSGSFPNLLSVLANKLLDRAMMAAPATYPRWTNRMPDLRDFKPATIVGVGDFNRLPLHNLGRPFEHSDFGEQVSWIQIDSYGDEFVMTPDMIVNDDLDGFTQAMRSKGVAHELTLNQLAVDLLVSNPVTADGNNMFSNGADSHDNLIDGNNGTPGGGPPNSENLSNNRLFHRRQVGISGNNKLRYDASVVLVSPVHETVAEQTLLRTITPQVEASVNVFQGRYTPVVEPMLDETGILNEWYSFVDPMLVRAIVHAFQTGYGRGGRRRTYFREETQCRHFQLEGRFAVAAVNHQAAVKNVGA